MRRQTGAGTIAALTLCCIFGATMLLSLVTGAGVYRRVQNRVEESARLRVGLSYLTARVHSFDTARNGEALVQAGEFGMRDALLLRQEIGGEWYETRLYVYDGNLMELFCAADADLGPADGQAITPARALHVTQLTPNLLRLEYTGAEGERERAEVYLRSEG